MFSVDGGFCKPAKFLLAAFEIGTFSQQCLNAGFISNNLLLLIITCHFVYRLHSVSVDTSSNRVSDGMFLAIFYVDCSLPLTTWLISDDY